MLADDARAAKVIEIERAHDLRRDARSKAKPPRSVHLVWYGDLAVIGDITPIIRSDDAARQEPAP